MAEKQHTPEEVLNKVNQGICNVIDGGQSYQIGSRKLVRPELSTLVSMKEKLEAQVNAEGTSSLLDNTYVAFFDGR